MTTSLRFVSMMLASALVLLLASAAGCKKGDAFCSGNGNGGNTTGCNFQPDPARGAGEPSDVAGMTEAHNYWRWRVGVAPVVWDAAIAANAQSYADTCPSGHSSNADRSNVAGFNSLGENLYFHSSASASAVGAVDSWASERLAYTFGTEISQSNFSGIGHYTQIVWSSTTAIGCGVARCQGGWATIVVCQYGPAGNFVGRAPYDYAEGECLDLDNDDVLQGDDCDDTERRAH